MPMSVIGMYVSTWNPTAQLVARATSTPYNPKPCCPTYSNTPKNPGALGTDTPIAINPCTRSAALNGAVMPTALNASQNATPFKSQCSTAQNNTSRNRPGCVSTPNPEANDRNAVTPRCSSPGATRRENSSNNRIMRPGKNTTRYNMNTAIATSTAPPVIHVATGRPATRCSRGNAGSSSAPSMSSSTTNASNTRSTASDAMADEKPTRGVSCVSAYARASSPARAGTTLFTIMPMAVARHKMPNGRSGDTDARIG